MNYMISTKLESKARVYGKWKTKYLIQPNLLNAGFPSVFYHMEYGHIFCALCCVCYIMTLTYLINAFTYSLHWHHNGRDGVSNHQPHDCLFNRFFQVHIKANIKAPRHWPLCVEFTGDRGLPAQMASNAENISIWWRHHGTELIAGVFLNTYDVNLIDMDQLDL